jgi:hypothetical protein
MTQAWQDPKMEEKTDLVAAKLSKPDIHAVVTVQINIMVALAMVYSATSARCQCYKKILHHWRRGQIS